MSWDPVCKCGHEAHRHSPDVSRLHVEYVQGRAETGYQACECELTIADVARRAARLEAAELFEPAPVAELRRMAEEP